MKRPPDSMKFSLILLRCHAVDMAVRTFIFGHVHVYRRPNLSQLDRQQDTLVYFTVMRRLRDSATPIENQPSHCIHQCAVTANMIQWTIIISYSSRISECAGWHWHERYGSSGCWCCALWIMMCNITLVLGITELVSIVCGLRH
jgi:hypothetical protein